MKTCNRCKQEYDETEALPNGRMPFCKNRTKKDGYNGACYYCRSRYQKEYRKPSRRRRMTTARTHDRP